jgi:DNA-binding XRE family transcriptional regulator
MSASLKENLQDLPFLKASIDIISVYSVTINEIYIKSG